MSLSRGERTAQVTRVPRNTSASYTDVSGGILIPTLFFLAIVKFALVVLWFMHLKFDDRRYARFFVMGLAGASILYLIVLISFKVFL